MCAACSRDWRKRGLGILIWIVAAVLAARYASAGERPESVIGPEPDHPGWKVLRERAFLPPDFDQDVFDRLPAVWLTAERDAALKLPLAERRKRIAEHYGLTLNPWAAAGEFDLLGYVKTERGWVMNCMACHSGVVDGRTIPGLGNNRFALQTLTEDVRTTKLMSLKPLSHLDLASMKLPLGTTNGTTNSVMFGVVLGAKRLPDMTVDRGRPTPPLIHHDMDAPPWWRLKSKHRLYADGFAPKTHRVIMQFMMLPDNDRDTIYGWEDDFGKMLQWMESTTPPKYDGPIDAALAANGRAVFEDHCARCHGTYGSGGEYLEKIVPIAEVGTDPVRLNALSGEHRRWMHDGWLSRFGEDPVDLKPVGYVAPPLNGIWATAPYLHNGSVPTLWHLLHPDQRPAVWRANSTEFDRDRIGLSIETPKTVPSGISDAERRNYFDTSRPGKSSSGHLFVNELTEPQKQAVLEYLKTL